MDDLLDIEREGASTEQGLAGLLRPAQVAQMLGVSRATTLRRAAA